MLLLTGIFSVFFSIMMIIRVSVLVCTLVSMFLSSIPTANTLETNV